MATRRQQTDTLWDTIPQDLKKLYFPNKIMPNLIRDYDAVGFSIDSCFVKYNEPEMTKLVVKTLLTSFHEDCKYPK